MTPAPAVDLPHRIFSRFFVRISTSMEAEGMADLRRELLGDLRGEVVEVGAGNGLNGLCWARGGQQIRPGGDAGGQVAGPTPDSHRLPGAVV